MHIFDVDTTTASPDDLRITTQAYLLAANAQFTFRASEILNLERVLRLTQLVATAAVGGAPVPALQSLLDKLPGGYRDAAATVLTGREKTDSALLRKAAVDLYETFELFLGDVLSVLFYAFPKFLTTAPENLVLPATHYDDLYGPASLLEARLAIARRKVAQLLQSENVVDLIKKAEQRFGVEIKSLSDEDRKALLEFSARRNLWVHSAGTVNEIYVRLLRRYGMSSPYATGAQATIDEAYVQATRDRTMRAATNMSQALFDLAPQIQQYHTRL